MPVVDSVSKDEVLAAAGRRGAESRWGPPGTRTVKIGDLSVPERRLVLALIDAARSQNETADAAHAPTAPEVGRVSAHTTTRAA